MGDSKFEELWIGGLPHEPNELTDAESGLRLALAEICRSSDKTEPDIRLRLHTRDNGYGLGFAFAWLSSSAAAQRLIAAGTIEYIRGSSTCAAAVRAARGHAGRAAPGNDGSSVELVVAVAGTFDLKELQGPAAAWRGLLLDHRIRLELRFAPRCGVSALVTQLGSRRGVLRRCPLTVIVWRGRDLVQNSIDAGANDAAGFGRAGRSLVPNLANAIRAARGAPGAGAFLFLEGEPRRKAAVGGGETRESADSGFAEAADEFEEAICGIGGCDVVTWQRVATLCPVKTQAVAESLCGIIVRRAMASPLRDALKVFVADCDHTLWNGVVSEDGVAGVGLDGPHVLLQQRLSALQQGGRLVCLASRNAEDADVLRVFEQRKDECPLKKEQLAAWQVNLGPKPRNLVRLAKELNLGLASFAFLDDNPAEIEAVRIALPEVLAIHVPADAEVFERLIHHHWALDTWNGSPQTAEDARRTDLYRENAQRRQERQHHASFEAFLSALHVDIDVREPYESDFERLSQLSLRTNQMNTTQLRLSEERVRSWAVAKDEGRSVIIARVSDKYGDYGLVGAVFCSRAENALVAECLNMSCRVLHRGVEQALLRHLASVALSETLEIVRIPVCETKRNDLVRGFLSRVTGWLQQQMTVASSSGDASTETSSDGPLTVVGRWGGARGASVPSLDFPARLLQGLEGHLLHESDAEDEDGDSADARGSGLDIGGARTVGADSTVAAEPEASKQATAAGPPSATPLPPPWSMLLDNIAQLQGAVPRSKTRR